jgi:hypothetical protein
MFLLARVASLYPVKFTKVSPTPSLRPAKQCGQTSRNAKTVFASKLRQHALKKRHLSLQHQQTGQEKPMNERHKSGVSAILCLLLAMAVSTLPLAAKSSPRSDRNAATSESTNSTTTTTAADRSTDTTQDTTTTTRRNVKQERRHSSGKKRGIIIGGTALTGMLVGASVAGPVGALAGAGVGAGVGMVLAHIF